MNQSEFSDALRLAEKCLGKSDPLMRQIIRRHGPCTLSPNWRRTPYQSLVQAVVYQQLSGKAAATIFDRFLALFPGERFPAPERVAAVDEELLRGAGLSRQKAAYIRGIAKHAVTGIVPTRRAALARARDEEIIERIVAVKGVGRWTVEMMLIFTLGRLDVWPVDDYGVRKGYSRAVGREDLVSPKELRQHGNAWAPYRSVAAWYFWRESEAATDVRSPRQG
jgi:DNA-3-methyladenine glycosylase II